MIHALLLVEILILVIALSVDAFVAAFSYGVNKIKLPLFSATIISIISTTFLAISLILGTVLGGFIPVRVAKGIAAGVLIFIGVIKLFDSLIKSFIKRHKNFDKKIRFKFFSFRCVLNIYADPVKADADQSKVLSTGEAAVLAIALSLDSLAGGFGAGLAMEGFFLTISFSLLLGVALMVLGSLAGRAAAKKTTINLSWLSGVLLIGLGVLNIFI